MVFPAYAETCNKTSPMSSKIFFICTTFKCYFLLQNYPDKSFPRKKRATKFALQLADC